MMAVGFFLNDLGAMMTPVLYMWREREKIMDMFEMVCGQRLLYNYMRIGGVSQDLPEDFMPAVKKFVAEMPRYIDEYDQLLAQNEILLARSKGVGILPRDTAIAHRGKRSGLARQRREMGYPQDGPLFDL